MFEHKVILKQEQYYMLFELIINDKTKISTLVDTADSTWNLIRYELNELIQDWMNQHIDPNDYYLDNAILFFRNKEDAVLFSLQFA